MQFAYKSILVILPCGNINAGKAAVLRIRLDETRLLQYAALINRKRGLHFWRGRVVIVDVPPTYKVQMSVFPSGRMMPMSRPQRSMSYYIQQPCE